MAGLRLYLLRHGKALARAEWDQDDALRPLTPEGEDEVRRVGAALAVLGVAPQVVVTSPLVRALRTAELVAGALGVPFVVDDRLSPGFDAAAAAAVVAGHRPAAAIMLVGHEPDFSAVVGALTGGRVACKKAGLARIDVDGDRLDGARLVWLAPPALLTKE